MKSPTTIALGELPAASPRVSGEPKVPLLFTSSLTALAVATTMSVLPSALKSPVAIEFGPVPTL